MTIFEIPQKDLIVIYDEHFAAVDLEKAMYSLCVSGTSIIQYKKSGAYLVDPCTWYINHIKSGFNPLDIKGI